MQQGLDLAFSDHVTSRHPPSRRGGNAILGYLTIAIGWFIPGAGHWLAGDRKRAVIFAAAIHGLFFLGLLLGGVRALDRPHQRLWNYAQDLAGWPMVVGSQLRGRYFPPKSRHPWGFAPLIQDAATAYCGLAGLLNALVLVDLFLLVAGPESSGSGPERSAASGGGGPP